MPQTTRGIVLRTVRHGDRTVVLKAWTERFGLRAYLVRTGGKGATAAALQPLNRLELVVDEHPEREMHHVRELRVERPYTLVPREAPRAALALFVQEVLYRTLRQEAPDAPLNAYLEDVLEAMDTVPDLGHFPLLFLLGLSRHLGFPPQGPEDGESLFDLGEGCFTRGGSGLRHVLSLPMSRALASLLGADPRTPPVPGIPAAHRRELLDHLLLYYRLHLDGAGDLRSPAVLHQLLS